MSEIAADPRAAKVQSAEEWRDYEARRWWDAHRRGLSLVSMSPDEARSVRELDERYAAIVAASHAR